MKYLKNIIRKKLGRTEVSPDHKYEIPKIPKNLQKPSTEKEIAYYKFIKELLKTHGEDPMTGLSHKQHFQELEKEPGIYIYIDGDGIKQINDSFGHDAGHAAIETLAKGIKDVMRSRESEKVTRFGGDEFVVHLKDASIATGVAVAGRILKSIKKQDIGAQYKGDSEIKRKLSKRQLGASLGVGKTEKEADKALYKAKEKGRNRVEFFKKK